MISITTEMQPVFRAGSIRFLTKAAAYQAAARWAVQEKHPCQCEVATNYACGSHKGTDWFDARVKRLARWLRWRDRLGRPRRRRLDPERCLSCPRCKTLVLETEREPGDDPTWSQGDTERCPGCGCLVAVIIEPRAIVTAEPGKEPTFFLGEKS